MSDNYEAIREEVLRTLRVQRDGINMEALFKNCQSAETTLELTRTLHVMIDEAEVIKLGQGKSASYMPGLIAKDAESKPKDWSRFERPSVRNDAQTSAAKQDLLRIGNKLSRDMPVQKDPDLHESSIRAYGSSSVGLASQAVSASKSSKDVKTSKAAAASARRPVPSMTGISDVAPKTVGWQRGTATPSSIAGRILYALFRCVDENGKHMAVSLDILHQRINDESIQRHLISVYLNALQKYFIKDKTHGVRSPLVMWNAQEYIHPFQQDVRDDYLSMSLFDYKRDHLKTKAEGYVKYAKVERVKKVKEPKAPKEPKAEKIKAEKTPKAKLVSPGVSYREREVTSVPSAIVVDEQRLINQIEGLTALPVSAALAELDMLLDYLSSHASTIESIRERAANTKLALQ